MPPNDRFNGMHKVLIISIWTLSGGFMSPFWVFARIVAILLFSDFSEIVLVSGLIRCYFPLSSLIIV